MDGSVTLPWVRLHGLKDYLGMVELLEETPHVHVTFNLVPSLMDQIEAYAEGRVRDALQRLGDKRPEDLDVGERVQALRGFFMAHPQNLVSRFPRFADLLESRGPRVDEASLRSAAERFSLQDLRDLQILAKLAWFDLGWQQRDPVLKELAGKGRGFSESDKARLGEREQALLAAVIPAYRRAAQSGQAELSTSPYYHPILPLLCDTESHHEAHPGAPVPRRFRHPEDAADQIQRAIARHEALFGQRPKGLWPSEGSVSEEAVLEIARAGVHWTASDEGVLERSVNHPLHRDSRGTAYPLELLYRSWFRRTAVGDVAILFRDRALSDLIGFTYSSLEPLQAAHDFLDRLRRIGERWQTRGLEGDPLVPIILDGENAWEHYKDGGRTFLREVYQGIESDPELVALTASEALAASPSGELPRVFAGSWISADFSVWIGHADDRKAWNLLGAARDALSRNEKGLGDEALQPAWEIFRAACGSDWTWWYGDDHWSESDLEFDRLFRRHLRAIYEHLLLPVPEALEDTLITSKRMDLRQSRPTGVVRPVLDGEITSPDEWVGAGIYRPALGTTMHKGSQEIRAVRFGVGGECLNVLVESAGPFRDLLSRADIVLNFPGTFRYRLGRDAGRTAVRREERTALGWVALATTAQAAAGSVLEVAIPLAELRPGPERTLAFRVQLLEGERELEGHPEVDALEVRLEEADPGVP
jgi:alpha-amylase/alpha-mannosidase (GH57 family)